MVSYLKYFCFDANIKDITIFYFADITHVLNNITLFLYFLFRTG